MKAKASPHQDATQLRGHARSGLAKPSLQLRLNRKAPQLRGMLCLKLSEVGYGAWCLTCTDSGRMTKPALLCVMQTRAQMS